MGRLRIDQLTGPPAALVAGSRGVVCARCHRARSLLARLVGLLATPDLASDEAVWIERCGCVHAIGLRPAICCAFLDGEGTVLRVVDPLPRWRVASARRARAVVECRAGALAGVRIGDVLRLG
jgi:uncharacterized membrane protein (UPF0127 family)